MSIPFDDNSQVDGELDMLAVQYVLGELSELDLVEFERRLASDLSACEAVARAARLTASLHSAFAECDSSIQPAGDSHRVIRSVAKSNDRSWLTVFSVVLVSAVVVFAMVLVPFTARKAELARNDKAVSELISLWRMGEESSLIDPEDLDIDGGDGSQTVDVPNWLLAAVSYEQSETPKQANDAVQEN